MTYKFVSFVPDKKRNYTYGLMTITAHRRPFPWLFVKERTQELQFHGGGTVWRKLPDFRSAGIFIEGMLSNFKAKWDYEHDSDI